MSNFQKLSGGVPRGSTVQSTDIGSGSATSTQFLAANGSGGSSYRSLVSGDIPSLSSIYLALSGGTMSGAINMGSHQINSVTDPTSAQDAATKNYVDNGLAQLNPKDAVYAASTTNIVGTYLNGVSGIGATFTVTATGAFTIDGTTPPALSRILIKDQTSGFQNGVYDLTIAGSIGVSPVLTRSLGYDTANDMTGTETIPVINGTVNQKTSWLQTATITTVGTDSLTFVQWTANPSSYLLKANNLSDVASASASFNNISPITSTGDLIIGTGTNTSSRLGIGSAFQSLTVNSGGTTATWSAVNLAQASAITGILPNANTTATNNATASTIVSRDANVNTRINNIIEGFTTTATAAGTTTLTVSSTYSQQFTGTTTQTVVLPDATTLVVGQSFSIMNRSTGVVTVNANGGTLVQTMAAGSQTIVTVTNIGSSAGTWDSAYSVTSGGASTVYRAGSTSIGNAATSLAIVFSSAMPNTSYAIHAQMINTTDTNPQFQPITITAQSTTGFTATWNNPTATTNYSLMFIVIANN